MIRKDFGKVICKLRFVFAGNHVIKLDNLLFRIIQMIRKDFGNFVTKIRQVYICN